MSTPETPAPLSFDSPQVQEAITVGEMCRILHAGSTAALLTEALTHEHEARVKAEKELAAAKKLADESEAHAQHESKLRDTMQTNCAGWAERIQQAEAERDSLRKAVQDIASGCCDSDTAYRIAKAALSGLPAQAVERCVCGKTAKECAVTDCRPSAGALGEREAAK